MNERWKIIQIFISLTPKKKINPILVSIIFLLLTGIPFGYFHFEKLLVKNDDEMTRLRKEVKFKDSTINAIQEKRLEFMDKQLDISYRHLSEIDSLKRTKQKVK